MIETVLRAYGHWNAITEDEVDEKKNNTTKGQISGIVAKIESLVQPYKRSGVEELKLMKKGFKVLNQRMKSKVEEVEEEEEDVVTKVEFDAMIMESLGILAM
nr:hypothetical protein [Tanacetum cinerariifolium]